MRACTCSLVSRSVSDTLIVRSNGSSPLWTRSSTFTVASKAKNDRSKLRRNRLRVSSIFLARRISSSRVSSGMFAICDRYMRIGSLDPCGMPSLRTKRAVAIGDVGFRLGQIAAMGVGAIDQFDAEPIDRGQHGVDAVGAFDFIGKKALTSS